MAIEPKACVKLDDRFLERRRRAWRRWASTGKWKAALERDLRPRSWRFIERATGLIVPIAIGILLVFILKQGGVPLVADLGGGLWPLVLP